MDRVAELSTRLYTKPRSQGSVSRRRRQAAYRPRISFRRGRILIGGHHLDGSPPGHSKARRIGRCGRAILLARRDPSFPSSRLGTHRAKLPLRISRHLRS